MNIYQRNDQFVTFSRGIQTRSLNDNIINRIFVDKNDNIWVGTDFGGINIMAPQRITFNYSLQGYEKGVPNIISTVLEDKEGNILAGIVDGGLAIKRKGADSFRSSNTAREIRAHWLTTTSRISFRTCTAITGYQQ